jgi:rubrerythrin
MGKSNRDMLDAIKHAMQAEANGHQFYKLAASQTDDEQGRKVFQMLADEELEHLRFLKRNYDSILNTGKTDEKAILEGKGEFSGQHPLFSPAFKERIGGAHFEMSALGIGVQLELSAIRFYREQAAQADDPNLKRLFQDLADWEVGHYDMFLKQQEELKELYWDAGGFSPF